MPISRSLAPALVLLVVLSASPAAAKFRSLHRQTGGTHADIALQFVLPDEADFDVLRTDLFAEIALGPIDVYAALPFTRSIDAPEDVSAMGNLELGLVTGFGGEDTGLLLHLGVAVPTAGDSAEDFAVNLFGSAPRAQDAFATALPDTTTVRIGATPRARFGPVFVQGDLGFDFLLIEDVDDETSYHLGAGAGVDLALVELTAEFVHTDFVDASLSSELDAQTLTFGATISGIPILKPFASYTTLLGGFGVDPGDVHVVAFGATLEL